MGIFDFSSKRPTFAEGIAQAKSTENAVLLDVRTPQEYAGGHVPGSVNLPLDRIGTIAIDKAQPLFVYCRSGARSGQACAYLSAEGYNAINIGGVMGYHGILTEGECVS